MLSNTILFTGIIMIGLLFLLLTSALLPPTKVLITFLILTATVAILLKAFFIKVYSKAQAAIRHTLERELPSHAHQPEQQRELPALLDQVELSTVHVAPKSPVIGKSIKGLKIRSRCGATVVVVRRGTENIVSPPPDFQFMAEDEILLMGTSIHLDEALKLFEN